MIDRLLSPWAIGFFACMSAGAFLLAWDAWAGPRGKLGRVLSLMRQAGPSAAAAAGRGWLGWLAWLTPLVRPALPDAAVASVQAALQRAGIAGWTAEEVYAGKLVLGLLGFAMIAPLMPGGGTLAVFLAVAAAVAGYFLPEWHVHRLIRERRRRMERELLPFLGLLATFCEAGLSLSEAIHRIASARTGLVAAEFRRASRESAAHLSRREAWQGLLDRSPSPELELAADAIAQAESQGVSVARAIRNIALSLEQQRQLRVQEIAQQRQAQMFFPLMLLLGAVLLITMGPLLLEMGDLLL